MAEHKGAITLLIAVLLLFSLWVFFGDTYISSILKDIGEGFQTMVGNVFNVTPDTPKIP